MRFASITVFLMLAFFVGVPLLQIYLSGKENKWLGLILPAITFLYSLVMIFSFAVYNGGIWDLVGAILSILLMSNIPTAVLLGIYFFCRDKYRKKAQIEKMNIQDL